MSTELKDAEAAKAQAAKDAADAAVKAQAAKDALQASEGAGSQEESGTKFTLQDYEKMIRELRSEAAKTRKEKQEAEKKLKDLEDANLSDVQKKEKKLADLEIKHTELQKRYNETALLYAVALQATKRGLRVDPKVAVKFLNSSDLEADNEGNHPHLDTALDSLEKSDPYLFGSGGTLQNPTNPAKKSGLTLEEVQKMTPAQINARWEEVSSVLEGGKKT